jgi:hypothetical protein
MEGTNLDMMVVMILKILKTYKIEIVYNPKIERVYIAKVYVVKVKVKVKVAIVKADVVKVDTVKVNRVRVKVEV